MARSRTCALAPGHRRVLPRDAPAGQYDYRVTITSERAVPSGLSDLTNVPLDEFAGLDAGILDEAIARILGKSAEVAVAAFNSAI